MRPEVEISRVEREVILALRAAMLGEGEARGMALSGDLAPTTRHWAAVADEAVVGCVSVMRLRGWALRGMAVALEHQRRGIGAALLRRVYVEIDAPMWSNARVQVVPFYSHLGWVAAGPTFVMANGVAHQRMTWTPA